MNQLLMMYETARHPACVAIGLMIIFLLTGCGGAATEEDQQPTINKPVSSTPSNPPSSSSKAEASSKSPDAVASTSSKSIAVSSSIRSSISQSSSSSLSAQSSSRQNSSTLSYTEEKDLTPPTPTKLFIQKIASRSLTIMWPHATDEMGIQAYKLERDGVLIATVEFPTYVYEDKGLNPNTSYAYSIRAVDTSDNVSEKSVLLSARTLAPSGTTSSINESQSSSATSSASTTSQHASNNSSAKSSSFSSRTSSSSNNQASSKSSQQSNSSFSSSSNVSTIVHLSWSHPTERGNGEYLELDEIAGYELRRKDKATSQIVYLVIEGNSQTEFTITDLTQNDTIDIAVYDTEGRYSDFIPIFPRTP